MARTAIAITDATTQPPAMSLGGVAVDAINNNMFLNDGRIIIMLSNPTGGSLNATILSIADKFGRSDTTFSPATMTAGQTRLFGPFLQSVWNQVGADIGNVYINAASGLVVQAFRLAAYGATP